MQFTHAIVRPPADNFAAGLTTAGLGPPHFERALNQHAQYCAALDRCGLALTRLPPDARHPDSTFVEDVAIATPGGALLTRPGAPSRRGEAAGIVAAVAAFFPDPEEIREPGTLDGGIGRLLARDTPVAVLVEALDQGGVILHRVVGTRIRGGAGGTRERCGYQGQGNQDRFHRMAPGSGKSIQRS